MVSGRTHKFPSWGSEFEIVHVESKDNEEKEGKLIEGDEKDRGKTVGTPSTKRNATARGCSNASTIKWL